MVDSVKRDGDDPGEAEGRLRGAEHMYALDTGKPANKSLAQRFYLRRIGSKAVIGLIERGCHAGDSRDVRGASAVPALLRAAQDERRGDHAVRAHECSHPARTVELVGGEREQVEAVAREVDGEVARCLDGVCVEERAALAGHAADVAHGLHGPHLVVCVHEGDETGVGAHGSLNVGHADEAVGIRLHQRDLEVSSIGAVGRGEELEHAKDARMFDGGGDDMAPALARAIGRARDQGLVVRLGSAGGELDLAGARVQALGDAAARAFEHAKRRVAGGVLARGVGEGVAGVDLAYGVERGGTRARGGGVVEVDDSHELRFIG